MEDRHKMKAKKDNIPMFYVKYMHNVHILPREKMKKEKA